MTRLQAIEALLREAEDRIRQVKDLGRMRTWTGARTTKHAHRVAAVEIQADELAALVRIARAATASVDPDRKAGRKISDLKASVKAIHAFVRIGP